MVFNDAHQQEPPTRIVCVNISSVVKKTQELAPIFLTFAPHNITDYDPKARVKVIEGNGNAEVHERRKTDRV